MKAFVPLIFFFVAAKGAAIGGGDHEEYVNENLVGTKRGADQVNDDEVITLP